ncbi:MAG: SMC-Scp complex subunit ScpB [bacterium]|nr:SMC-Scp complex subunit ScpB [bacterium]
MNNSSELASSSTLLANQIEALLFTLGTLSRKELMQQLSVSSEGLEEALAAVRAVRQSGSGIVLVDDGKTLELRASENTAGLIEKVRKEEYAQSIGRAGLEALAAILYRGPLTRLEIDFIRGVNSTQTLRTLAMRGLVRRVEHPKDRTVPDGRRGSFLYEATTETLAHLGISKLDELPEYDSIRKKLHELEQAYRDKEEEQITAH